MARRIDQKDYYKILEVDRDVTSDGIKAAYKQLAIKWHPDKNLNNIVEAETKFKQISEAYQVGVLVFICL
jgi:DnaJ-class molecular chaperone